MSDYTKAIEAAAARVAGLGRLSPQVAQERALELARLPGPRVALVVGNSARFACPEISVALTDLAYRVRYTEPYESVRLARLATTVASALEHYPRVVGASCTVRAMAFLGNALRVTGDLNEASEVLGGALELYAKEQLCDPLLGARVTRFEATLLMEQGRNDEALAGYLRAVEVYRQLGDLVAAGNSLVSASKCHARSGARREAAVTAMQALELVSPTGDEEALIVVLLNLGLVFADCENPLDGLAILDEAAALLPDTEQSTRRAKLTWSRARLCEQAGRHAMADQYFDAAAEYFEEAQLWHELGQIRLEHAAALEERGDKDGVAGVAAALVPVLTASQVDAGGRAAVGAFVTAALQHQASADLIDDTAGKLGSGRPSGTS